MLKKRVSELLDSLEIKRLLKIVKPYTMIDEVGLRKLATLANHVNSKNIKGDFVECGTYKGGSAAVLSRYMGQNRHLWIYDSFEGMPAISDNDCREADQWVGKCIGTVDDVHAVMKLVSTRENRYAIKKGWFEQTFRDKLPEKVSLLHCDADWYDSVTMVLNTFYALIPSGGIVILDDFGYWEGSKDAFYDFCYKHNERPLIERVGSNQAYWIKGKTNNRR